MMLSVSLMRDYFKCLTLLRWASPTGQTSTHVQRCLAVDQPPLALNSDQTKTHQTLMVSVGIWLSILISAYLLLIFVWRPDLEQRFQVKANTAHSNARFTHAAFNLPVSANITTRASTHDPAVDTWSPTLTTLAESLFLGPSPATVSSTPTLQASEEDADVQNTRIREAANEEVPANRAPLSTQASPASPSLPSAKMRYRIAFKTPEVLSQAIAGHWQRAEALEAQGQLDAALALYQAVLHLDANHALAQQALIRLQANTHSMPQADANAQLPTISVTTAMDEGDIP